MKNLNTNEIFSFLIPTGVGASIGGYAGDGSFWAQQFSKIRPTLVNANVVNAACFSGITERILYSEGWAIDEFFNNRLNFVPHRNNKIGIIFDKSIPQDVLNVHINTINAVKTVYNVDIAGYEITEKEVGIEYRINDAGTSDGCVKNPKTMVEAGKKLLKQGAEVLAIVCLFPDDEDDTEYASGNGVDPVGGLESIISHYICKELFVPCVHAPAFKNYQISSEIVDKRVAAEYITPTFLPCLLLGLKDAPLYTKDLGTGLNVSDTKALIIPYSTLGSPAVFGAIENKIPVFAVEENKTVLNVTNEHFLNNSGIIVKDTYKDLYYFLEKEYEKNT